MGSEQMKKVRICTNQRQKTICQALFYTTAIAVLMAMAASGSKP